jgi:sterol desaturase/sphingolipid hydroxylase (fatty acid hydroxylase superfamily)
MLTDEESQFVEYWEANRLRRKRFFRQLAIGLPSGAILVIAIFFNFLSGWHHQADIEMRSQAQSQSDYGSIILVLVVAALLIVVFTSVFSARHRWEMNEQRYKELQVKKDQP